jgi:hypothetical protein
VSFTARSISHRGTFLASRFGANANGCLVSPNVGLFWPVDLELTGVLSPKNDHT